MQEESATVETARILVVEDDTNNRIVITRLLKLSGVGKDRIFESDGDPEEFLRNDTLGIDLVLLDLQLPHKDGYAILKDIKAMPSMAGTKTVALTANVMREDLERARNAGFFGFIGKPIDGPNFPGVLRRILAGESIWTI